MITNTPNTSHISSSIYTTNIDLNNWLTYASMGFYFQSPSYYRQFSDPNAFKLISKLFVQKKITLTQYELLLKNLSTFSTYVNNGISIGIVGLPYFDDLSTPLTNPYRLGNITYTT